jgi:hypothetical protein
LPFRVQLAERSHYRGAFFGHQDVQFVAAHQRVLAADRNRMRQAPKISLIFSARTKS